MRDKKGVLRGACREAECDCEDYMAPEEGQVCEYCGHYPPMHKNMTAEAAAAAHFLKKSSEHVVITVQPAPDNAPSAPEAPSAAAQSDGTAIETPPAVLPTAGPAAASPAPEIAAAAPVEEERGQCPICMAWFPRSKLEAHAGRCDGVPPPSAAAAVEEEAKWPADTADILAEALPHTFPRVRIEAAMQVHKPVGDLDGLLAHLLVSAEAEEVPRQKAPEMDEETRKLIETLSVAEADCIICLDTLPVTEMYTVNCPSSHRFCYACIARWVMLAAKDNLAITCPAPNNSCKHVIVDDEVRQIATVCPEITPDIIKRIEEQTLMRGIQSIPGVIGCPTAGCPNWVVPSDTRRRERCVCQACRFTFCSLCKKNYHYGCTCEEVVQYAQRWMQWCATGRAHYNKDKAEAMEKINSQRAELEKRNGELQRRFQDLEADEKYKESNGRYCPNCNRVIIKDGGCDSMVCGRDYHGGNVQDGCGAAFSWSSAQPYRPASLKGPKLEKENFDIPEIAREVVHIGVACDECRREIKGLRFSCLHCPALDLCESCECTATLRHDHTHVFRIISTPTEL